MNDELYEDKLLSAFYSIICRCNQLGRCQKKQSADVRRDVSDRVMSTVDSQPTLAGTGTVSFPQRVHSAATRTKRSSKELKSFNVVLLSLSRTNIYSTLVTNGIDEHCRRGTLTPVLIYMRICLCTLLLCRIACYEWRTVFMSEWGCRRVGDSRVNSRCIFN